MQANSAGLNAVIGIDSREVLRLPAPKLGHAPSAAGSRQAIKPRCAELIEAHVRRTQPVAELLKAEESSEVALSMINKERERHEIESLLPWHAAGTLDRCDAECVERALAEDSELARRYELVREELAETIRVNEMLGTPSALPWKNCSLQSTQRRRVRPARLFSALAEHQPSQPRLASSSRADQRRRCPSLRRSRNEDRTPRHNGYRGDARGRDGGIRQVMAEGVASRGQPPE